MNWSLPGNGSAMQNTFWNQDQQGMRSLYQNMSDYFTNKGSNGAMAGWFANQFGANNNRFMNDAIQNPNLQFTDWLQAQAPQLQNQFQLQSPSARGLNPGFMHAGRDLW